MSNKIFSKAMFPALVTGAVLMAVVSITVGKFFEYTNTTEFCISCHEMENTVYEEYKTTLHFKNESGVRATCPDCHVPKSFPGSVIAKFAAYKDVLHTILGTIDTTEKFEKHRLAMAERVWAKMEASNSEACLNCHAFDAMILEEQGRRGRKKHPQAEEEGKTCINCHKGVVHTLPEDYEEDDED